jgi:predicted transcriptional regulator
LLWGYLICLICFRKTGGNITATVMDIIMAGVFSEICLDPMAKVLRGIRNQGKQRYVRFVRIIAACRHLNANGAGYMLRDYKRNCVNAPL